MTFEDLDTLQRGDLLECVDIPDDMSGFNFKLGCKYGVTYPTEKKTEFGNKEINTNRLVIYNDKLTAVDIQYLPAKYFKKVGRYE